MAEEHVEERFSMDSIVQGFHVYKDVWNPEIGEVLICKQEFQNLHDPYTVSIICEDNVIRSWTSPSSNISFMLASFFKKKWNNFMPGNLYQILCQEVDTIP